MIYIEPFSFHILVYLDLSRSILFHISLSWFISDYLDLFRFTMVYLYLELSKASSDKKGISWLFQAIMGYFGLSRVLSEYNELSSLYLAISDHLLLYVAITGYLWLTQTYNTLYVVSRRCKNI